MQELESIPLLGHLESGLNQSSKPRQQVSNNGAKRGGFPFPLAVGTTPPSRPYKPGQDVAITAIQARARRRHHGHTSLGKTSPSRPYKQDAAMAIQARARRRHYCHISPGKTPPSRPYKQDVYTVSVPANRRSNSPLDEIRWKLESSPSSLSNQLAQPQSVPGEVEHGRANPCRRVIFRPAQIHPNLLLIWPPSSSHVRRESEVRKCQ
ncbi:hypothetical protein E2P81_ATG07721 [Venturia nashicola]|nr:hypothetical protein E2P81_ATG07721 [Venturia nashicola]